MSREIPAKQKRVLVDLSDDKEKYLVGWPGYRNAQGRSGLGYVENRAEWAHMQGRIFMMLLRNKVITRDPLNLLLMSFVSVICCLPLILGLPEMLRGSGLGFILLLLFSPAWLFGLLILRHVYNAIFGWSVEEEDGRESEE